MDIVYPDEGLTFMLLQIPTISPGLHYHLFSNAVVIDGDTVLADLVLMDGVFPPVYVDNTFFILNQVVQHIGSIQGLNLIWTNLSGVDQKSYGYCVTDPTDAFLIQAGNWDAVPLVTPNGGQVSAPVIFGSYSALQS